MMSTILVVAAHPDDEVLGCGGTIAKLTEGGAVVHVAFLADGVGARSGESKPDQKDIISRQAAAKSACAILGTQLPSFGDFPDNQLDAVPRLRVINSIEKLIVRCQPDTIFTHHSGDVNIDHRLIHDAVVTACRPQPGRGVRRLLFFEVASSTEWQAPGSAPPFVPNVFVDISMTLEQKLKALNAYNHEMRAWPHARSVEAVEHQGRWRGATAGMEAAEAFMLGRELF